MGRRRVHRNDAERAAAFRRRRAGMLAFGEMSRSLFKDPTVDLLFELCRRIAVAAADPAAAGAAVTGAVLAGLEAGGGRNCADAARNVVRGESPSATHRAAPVHDAMNAEIRNARSHRRY